MQYTSEQLRDAVGRSKEAFRYWKRVLPAFPGGKSHGRSTCPGDVLASTAFRRLTQSCGVHIGQLKGVSTGSSTFATRYRTTYWQTAFLGWTSRVKSVRRFQRQTGFPAITPSWCARWRR